MQRFSDQAYYEDKVWSREIALREERKLNKEISAVLYEFQFKGLYKKEDTFEHITNECENFDMNYDYLSLLTLRSHNSY